MISACQGLNDLGQLVPGEFPLRRLATQRLQAGTACGDLLVAEYERERGPAAIGGLELRLEAAAATVNGEAQARKLIAELFGQDRSGLLGRLADHDQIHLRRGRRRGERALIHERDD